MHRALVIEPTHTPRLTRIDAYLPALQDLVGGYIEGLGAPDADWHAYCNEEGKIEGLPINRFATALAHALGWPVGDVLVGTVVFLGVGIAGNEADVPNYVIDAAERLIVGTIERG
jgi:hypothetical protein